MVRPLRPQPHARAVVQPQPSAFRLACGHFQTFTAPNAFNALVVAGPAFSPQQSRHPTVAIAPMLPRPVNDRRCQRRFVVGRSRRLALRRTVLIQHLAGKTLGDVQLGQNMLNARTTTRSAQKFPEAASFSTSFSSVRSATARRKRPFSCSRTFSRFTWSSFKPPNSERQR